MHKKNQTNRMFMLIFFECFSVEVQVLVLVPIVWLKAGVIFLGGTWNHPC